MKFTELVTDDALALKVETQLRRATVFLTAVDENAGAMRVAGTAVAADLHGTKVLLTAGHVLRNFAREFEQGRIWLQTPAEGAGRLVLRPGTVRLCSPGGDEGPDAGIIVIDRDQVETYYQFGQVEPVAATTIRIDPLSPPMGFIVAGFPRELAQYGELQQRDGSTARYMRPTFAMYATAFVEADDVHYWLAAHDRKIEASGALSDFVGGEMNGMSGCGAWTVLADPATHNMYLYLRGVHTGTLEGSPFRLRTTPVVHHLRLIATLNDRARETVERLWPSVALDE